MKTKELPDEEDEVRDALVECIAQLRQGRAFEEEQAKEVEKLNQRQKEAEGK